MSSPRFSRITETSCPLVLVPLVFTQPETIMIKCVCNTVVKHINIIITVLEQSDFHVQQHL